MTLNVLDAIPAAPPGTTTRWSLNGTRGTGPSDGAWWPRSTDLAIEIADLDVAVHNLLHQRIARVSYIQGTWMRAPRKMATSLGIIKFGWFSHARYPENIDLSLTGFTHLVLTVIPPGTDADFARIVLADYGTVVIGPTDVTDTSATPTQRPDAESGDNRSDPTRAHYGHLFD